MGAGCPCALWLSLWTCQGGAVERVVATSARPGGRLAAHHGPAGCKQEGRNCGAGCFRNGSSCRRRRHHAEKNLRRNSGRLAPGGRAVIAATSRSNRPGRLGAGSQPAAKRAGRSPPWATAVGERRVAAGLVVVGQWRWNAQSRPVVLPHGAAAASAPPRGGGATHADELRPREGADRDPSPTADRLSGGGAEPPGRWGSSAARTCGS